jgi:hypothetical protein
VYFENTGVFTSICHVRWEQHGVILVEVQVVRWDEVDTEHADDYNFCMEMGMRMMKYGQDPFKVISYQQLREKTSI